MLADAWRCSNCAGETFDASGFEVPRFCCRCGDRFNEYDYKGKLLESAKETEIK
jgi:hypothetical protein